MIIDCISDLHGFYPKLKGGDLLIIAGDLTARDSLDCWTEFHIWMNKQKYKKVIYIGGNHDNALEGLIPSSAPKSKVDHEYLCDSGTQFEGLKIWGSPWTRNFTGQNPKAKAFSLENTKLMKEKWILIPEKIDILITHSPPNGILDQTWKNRCGCSELRRAVARIQPKLHVFGHIHEAFGKEKRDGITYVNASYVNEHYDPINQPIRVLL